MNRNSLKNLAAVFSCSLLFAAPLNAALLKAPVADPYKFVWERDEGKNAGLVRFFLDINDDQIPDLFVGSKSLMGNGGGIFHVFLVSRDHKYKSLGVLDLNPAGFEILPTKHHGVHDIKGYWHMSAADGDLNIIAFDGKEFKKKTSKRIGAAEFSKQISPIKVEIEESGATLNWVP